MSLRRVSALTLCLLMTGCSLFIRNPDVTVKDVNLAGLNGEGVTIEFLLDVSNPNFFDLRLHGYRYDLRLSDLPVARDETHDLISFPGHAVTEVRLPVKIGYRALVELLGRRPDPASVPYHLIAGLELETTFGTRTVPVEKSGTVAIPKKYRPDYYLRKLSDLVNGGK